MRRNPMILNLIQTCHELVVSDMASMLETMAPRYLLESRRGEIGDRIKNLKISMDLLQHAVEASQTRRGNHGTEVPMEGPAAPQNLSDSSAPCSAAHL